MADADEPTVTSQILDLLRLQHEILAHADPGQEPALEDQFRYYLARRDLFRRCAEATFDIREAREAIEAYGAADRMVLQLGARMKTRAGAPADSQPGAEAMARLAGQHAQDSESGQGGQGGQGERGRQGPPASAR